jgi:predicted transcriptional regulator
VTGRTSVEVARALLLIRERGMTAYAAAKVTGIALSTIYRSAGYRAWRAANPRKIK